ncbi:tetratricopeptide repeat-containing sensor histidine kinase [Pedobacter arcticus]|uniref:tetratricopeptide repeat-containing sensor histidine kinase n=1 Tax=Pedobacter arcticus TaxID=752140 RepID=UPI0002D722F1|nr:tetratricopeptide repeat-containing sensor histidine kinase [Pedobacter arcticus]
MKNKFTSVNWIIGYLIFAVVSFSSCEEKHAKKDDKLHDTLNIADSLILAADKAKALMLLQTVDINNYSNKAQVVNYQVLYAIAEKKLAPIRSSLAQKTLKMFDDELFRDEHLDLYFKTLVLNGDVSYENGNQLTALNFYVEAKSLPLEKDCKKGYLFSRFAQLYSDQKDYVRAAEYNLKSYYLTKHCQEQKLLRASYYRPEMCLNNAGFFYFKNRQLDSAAKYYKLFEERIAEVEKAGEINTDYANLMRGILYDNLGGLNLKLGNLPLAEAYVQKSLAMNKDPKGDILIPPYLKLAEIYTLNGQYNKALLAFNKSRSLLDIKNQKPDLYTLLWYKKYADYFHRSNQPDSAFYYQKLYSDTSDSLALKNEEISNLDVAKEMKSIVERQELTKLRHSDQVRRIYVAGLIEFLVLILIIITLVYHNLRKVKRLHRESVKDNEAITSAIDELERANKNYIRIMRIMAHDLRNPLSGMSGLASALLDDDNFDEESSKMLKLIESTGLHSIEMINELLKTGLANEDTPIETQSLDLKALLYDSVELLQFKAKEKQQQIIFENQELDEPVFSKVNYEKVWRVLNNLLVNAIKFSLIGGVIKTGIKEYKSSIVIYVSDNGIGIADKDKESVFDMFTEAKRTGTSGEQPFGLGLSISRKIMEKHSGKIWFEGNVDVGTTFFIEFPKS